MKTYIATLSFILLSFAGFSLKEPYAYGGRSNPSIKQEKLKDVTDLDELVPELWKKMGMPGKDRDELERRRKKRYSLGYYLYPEGGYSEIVEYISVEISAVENGKTVKLTSAGSLLTAAQRNMLNAADPDSDLHITVSYRYKNYVDENLDLDREIKQGGLNVSIVPDAEAQYPGGFKELSNYFTTTVFNKLSEKSAAHNIGSAAVKFTVDEKGKAVNAYLLYSSGDQPTDKLILDAIAKMPLWQPAKNSKGKNVKQEFSIPFGSGGC